MNKCKSEKESDLWWNAPGNFGHILLWGDAYSNRLVSPHNSCTGICLAPDCTDVNAQAFHKLSDLRGMLNPSGINYALREAE